jgi:hypothetical protein
MEIWKHVKTDSLYLVLGEASCSTNGIRDGVEKSVIYYSLTYQRWFYREAKEFYDGRFVKVEAPEWKGKPPPAPFVKQPDCEYCQRSYEYCNCFCYECEAELAEEDRDFGFVCCEKCRRSWINPCS